MSKITFNTNIFSSLSQRSLNDASGKLSEIQERLSTGLRINKAKDDAAGVSISSILTLDSRINAQRSRNISDAISTLDVVSSALDALALLVSRQQELSAQAANGTVASKQKNSMNDEVRALTEEYNRIVRTTNFNGKNLLSDPDAELNFYLGGEMNGAIGLKLTEFISRFEGDGTFSGSLTYSLTGAIPNKIYHGDLNGDGIEDIVTASSSSIHLNILTNNGDGYFQQASVSTGVSVLDFRLADVNGDGHLDIITTHTSTMRVRLGNGDSSFKAQSIYSAGSNPSAMAVGDLNGDGILDVLTSSSSLSLAAGVRETTRIDFTTNGVASQDQVIFTDAASLTNSGYFRFTTPANNYYVWMDIDGAGIDPLQPGTGIQVSLLSSDSAAQVAAKVAAAIDPLADISSSALGNTVDLDRAQVGTTSTTTGNLAGLSVNSVTTGSNQTIFSGQYLNLNTGSGDYYVWYDVDGGGGDPLVGGRTGIKVDISAGSTATQIRDATRSAISAVATGVGFSNPNPSRLEITENNPGSITNSLNVNVGGVTVSTPVNGVGSNFDPISDQINLNSHGLSTGDQIQFNSSGSLPTGIVDSNIYYVIYVSGSNFRIASSYANAIASNHINFSGYGSAGMSITTPSSSLGGLILLGNSNGSFNASTFVSMPGSKSNLELADINGDGILDLVSGNTTDNMIDIRYGTGNGTFDNLQSFSTAGAPSDVKLGDFNGDGIVDIAYTNRSSGGNNSVGVALGTGGGGFSEPVNYFVNSSPYRIEIVDLNGDGTEDIAVINYFNSTSQLISSILGNGDGTFRASTSFLTGVAGSQFFTAADFNGDGVTDFASLNSVSSRATFNYQNSTQTTTKKNLSINSQEAAKLSLEYHKELADKIARQRASIGSTQSRLQFALQQTNIMGDEYRVAAATILDADIAAESASMVANKIRQQFSTSMLRNAAELQKGLLDLLKF